MQEAIELLKKVLTNEGDIGMHIEWNVGFREGIEHCIATLEAAQQSVYLTAFGFGVAGFGLGLVVGVFLVTI